MHGCYSAKVYTHEIYMYMYSLYRITGKYNGKIWRVLYLANDQIGVF